MTACIEYLRVLTGVYIDDSTILARPECLIKSVRLLLLFFKLLGFKVSHEKVHYHMDETIRAWASEQMPELADLRKLPDELTVQELIVSLGLGYKRGRDFIELVVPDDKVLKAHNYIEACRDTIRTGSRSFKPFERLMGLLQHLSYCREHKVGAGKIRGLRHWANEKSFKGLASNFQKRRGML